MKLIDAIYKLHYEGALLSGTLFIHYAGMTGEWQADRDKFIDQVDSINKLRMNQRIAA